MTNSVNSAVFNRVSRLKRPPTESTPKRPKNEPIMFCGPIGAGVEKGLDGIGGARMAFVYPSLCSGRGLVDTVITCDSAVAIVVPLG